MAYEYDCTDDALNAAREHGIDESKVGMDHDSGKYGWKDEEKSADSANADNPDDAPANGLVILVVSGPVLPALAELRASKLATRLGLTFRVLDSVTHEEIARHVPKVGRGKGGTHGEGSSLQRDEYGLTPMYRAALDLMMRPANGVAFSGGATLREIKEGGGSNSENPAIAYIMRQITKASGGRFVPGEVGGRVERVEVTNKKTGKTSSMMKANLAYTMVELPEDQRAAALEAVKAELEEKHQGGKKADEADVPNTNAANDGEKSEEQVA